MKIKDFDYDSIPPGYYHDVLVDGRSGHRFWHRQKFILVAESLPAGIGTLLDVGCGPGSFFYMLTELGVDIPTRIGCDLSKPQLAYAREHIGDAEWISADASNLPMADASVDVISMIEVLEHFPPERENEILREFTRVLKPGGLLVMTTPNYASHWPIIEWIWERLSPIKYGDQHLNKKNRRTLRRSVEAAAFDVVSCRSFYVVSPLVAVVCPSLAGWLLRQELRWLPWAGAICIIVATRPRSA